MKKLYSSNPVGLITVLLLILIVVSCQRDEFQKNPNSKTPEFSTIWIPFDELSNKSKVEATLNKILFSNSFQEQTAARGTGDIYDSIHNFTVHMDEVFKATGNGNHHWLTFYISRADTTPYLENLILSWNDSLLRYDPYLAKYDFTTEDLYKLEHGGVIEEFLTKTSVTAMSMPDDPCYDVIYTGPIYGPHGQIIYYTGYIVIEVPCEGEGGGEDDGNGDNNGDTGPGWGWWSGHDFGNNDSDVDVGDGGGTDGNESNDDIDPPPNDSGHTPIIVSTPIQDTGELGNSELKKIENLLNDYPTLLSNLQMLDGQTGQSGERGKMVVNSTNIVQSVPFGTTAELEYDADPSGEYICIAHTHCSPASSTYSIFSWTDLTTFATLLKTGELDADRFVAFLFTADGTRYALTINDATKFSKFFALGSDSNFNMDTGLKRAEAVVKYYRGKDGAPSLITESTIVKNSEAYFLDMIKDYDMGLTLFEIDQTLTTFTKLGS